MRSYSRIPIPAALAAAILCGLALPVAAATMTFDYELLGTTWGAAYGQLPGDIVMSEDGISMSVEEFHLGAYTGFLMARIDPTIPGFGSVQTLNLNNISGGFDLTGTADAGGGVRFSFADLGGEENLQVNGGMRYEVFSLADLHATWVTATVWCEVTTWNIPGGFAGEVVLVGPVHHVLVGGQEFWMDNLSTIAAESPCDIEVTHDHEPLGMAWGGPHGQVPGDVAFVENGVPVLLDTFDYGTGTAFHEARIDPAFGGFGFLQVMGTNNINVVYDISALGMPVGQVTFEYADLGGMENIRVNGGPLHIGEITAAPNPIAPGVFISIVTQAMPGGTHGHVTLAGDVQELLVGGQEFWMDNVCVIAEPFSGTPEQAPARDLLSLAPAAPNPFNPATMLSWTLARDGQVTVDMFDARGRRVARLLDGPQVSGSHSLRWEGRDDRGRRLPSGVYFVRVRALGEMRTQKLVMLQ